MVALAFLAALVAVQAFSAKPAEAGVCLYCGSGGGNVTPINLGGATTVPANDNFSAAQGVAQQPTSFLAWFTGNTTLATLEAGEPKPYSAVKDCGVYGISNSGISNSVWFKFTPRFTGQIQASTYGSSFDTVLGLYKGSSLTSLQQVSCSNDNSSNWTESMTAGIAAGQTYYLQLSGTGGLRSGAYKLGVAGGTN